MASEAALLRYFRSELEYLKRESARFSVKHATAAARIGVDPNHVKDPDVELMLQSFALLAGRLRYGLDVRQALIPEQLSQVLNPHLAVSVPCMAVAQLEVDPAGANYAKEIRLKPGTALFADVRTPTDSYTCQFRTRAVVTPQPLKVSKVGPASVVAAGVEAPPAALAALAITVRAADGLQIGQLAQVPWRLFLSGPACWRLRDLLDSHVVAIATQGSPDSQRRLQPAARVVFERAASACARARSEPFSHAGLSHLREFYLFPEQYLFPVFDGLDLTGYEHEVTLIVYLSAPCPPCGPDAFAFNCVALENLFRARLEPTRLDAWTSEYRLIGEYRNHDVCEVHSIDELVVLDRAGHSAPVPALYGLERQHVTRGQQPSAQWYHTVRRELSQLPVAGGTELFVALRNAALQAASCAGSLLAGSVLCSNRRLPEQLAPGARARLEVPGPVTGATFLTQPSRHDPPQLEGDTTRRLVLQQSLSSFRLESGPKGLERLKALLRQHLPGDVQEAADTIRAMTALEVSRMMIPADAEAWHGLVPGQRVCVTVDERDFERASPLVLGHVLDACLAHFVPVNGCVQLEIRRSDGTLLRRFEPSMGDVWSA